MGTKSVMGLGNFSVSLAVRDLAVSRTFYEALGFTKVAGNPAQNWLILGNGSAIVGLFQGHIDGNTLTFNPGWDGAGNTLPEFTDVRDIQRHLKHAGIMPVVEADESTTGPAFLKLVDPDGNLILIDQHV
jgi:lactoylglutathione lyase